jgi:hypothetical protein
LVSRPDCLPNQKKSKLSNTETDYSPRFAPLRKAIWIYIFLLIFEGAVRKWVPGLGATFLLIRDPIALFIWIVGIRRRVGSPQVWLIFHCFAFLITILGSVQIISSQVNPIVILYGWRSYVLHIPVVIVMASLLNERDLRAIGRWFLLMAIPMTLLMMAQYHAPPDSFLNRGSTEGGGQITGALGHIRPAGTFSFITGPISFYPLVAALCFWGLMRKSLFPKWIVIMAAIATTIAIPISVSRTIAITIAAMSATAAIGFAIRSRGFFKADRLPRLFLNSILGLLILIAISRLSFFQDAVATFATRWTQAQGSAGDNSELEARSVSLFTEALVPVDNTSLTGTGIGSGSSVAAALNGRSLNSFVYGESASQREVYELGSLLGPLFVIMRILCTVFLVVYSFKSLSRGALLSWLLIIPAAMTLALGGLDVATSQGFTMVLLGLCLASLRFEQRPKYIKVS